MNVEFNKIDNVNANITISLVEEDYSADYKKTLNELGRRNSIKGFRRGHVPAALLRKLFGPQAMSQVVDRKVSSALREYIVNNDVNVLGEPMLAEGTNVDLMNEKEFSFTFNVGLEPEFQVELDKISVTHYDIEVTDALVDDHIAVDRKNYGKQLPGEVSEADSMLRGTLSELDENGEVKENGIHAERTVIAIARTDNSEQKARLVGLHPGDSVTVNPALIAGDNKRMLESMLEVDSEVAEQATGDFRLDVDEVMVYQDAELNQEFFDTVLGKDVATTEQEYRDKVHAMIASQFAADADYRFTIDARKAIVEQVGALELPEDFLKRYFLSVNEGVTAEQIAEDFDASRDALVWQLILSKIERQLQVKLEAEDLVEVARNIAAQQLAQYGLGNAPAEVIDNYANRILKDERMSSQVRDSARERKIFTALKQVVTVVEHTVSLEEFSDLFKQAE